MLCWCAAPSGAFHQAVCGKFVGVNICASNGGFRACRGQLTSLTPMWIHPLLLNEFNYLPWLRVVTLALGGRSKLGFINGNIEAPDVSSPNYESWLCKDQLVMSWLLNSMEQKVAEIFSFYKSSFHLWEAIKEMYGNQNNSTCVFQLKKDIASLQQEGKPFIQLLGSMKSMWNELELLESLSSKYEDLRSHILMNLDLPSFANVCATIQREEIRRTVMNMETKANTFEARAYMSNNKHAEEREYKGKRLDLKCHHCNNTGHVIKRCWILQPELKPKFAKDTKGAQKCSQNSGYKANHATSSTDGPSNFTSNPVSLINEFAAYLQKKNGGDESKGVTNSRNENSIALLGKFAGFLAKSDKFSHEDIPDSGATDHMTNKITNLYDFEKMTKPSQDLVTKKTIGEGFYLNGLYYLSKDFQNRKGFHVESNLAQDQHLWH
ncbi:unnamed protein product [Prunus armeniaca]|uniref:Retrotransposon Copia-like N-terminal domain-containing protein n=1 Tax=Prunus armeniaca TaxID=36596 RepID=A0A6J5WPN1_PRUAR|nr:unnamed protein product [Prunus armeniaca]